MGDMPKRYKKMTSTNQESLEYQEKIRKALKARKEGLMWSEIAKQVGMAEKTIAKAVQRLLAKELLDDVRELKRLQMYRLESLIAPLMVKAEKGSFLAIDRLIKIFDRQAKLFGLDSPLKTALTDSEGVDKPIGQVVFYLPENNRDKPQENGENAEN